MTQVPEVFPSAPQPAQATVDDPPLELADELLPPEQDALPQGVLELLAVLAPRRQPVMGGGRGVLTAAMIARGEVAPGGSPSIASSATLERAVTWTGTTLPGPKQTRLTPIDAGLVAQGQPVRQPSPVTEPSLPLPLPLPLPLAQAREGGQPVPQAAEPSPPLPVTSSIQRPVNVDTPTAIIGAAELTRAGPVPLTGSSPPPTAPPVPLLEQAVEDLPLASREVLQVPFNKGGVNGQVSVTRAAGESAQHLVLSADNSQVLEQLREPFAEKAEPFWRLADSDEGHQRRHGSQSSPDEEQADPDERPS